VATFLPIIDVETPRTLVLTPPLTDGELEALSLACEWFRLERNREGEISLNPLSGGLTSTANAEINYQLYSWAKTHELGRVFDSGGTFFLPDGSMLNPDASYVLESRLKVLTQDEMTGFPRLCLTL
jgi:Uma2 family endonuclease